jgi:hypothetical protein
MNAPERHMQTDFVSDSGLDKRTLGADEVDALAAAQQANRYCLDMSWGTRAPRYCGRKPHAEGGHIYYSPLQIQAGLADDCDEFWAGILR